MKRILLLILMFASLSIAMAQPSSVKKMIKKFDAPYLKDPNYRYNSNLFWYNIWLYDKNVYNYDKAVKRKDKTLNQAYNVLLYYGRQYGSYDYTTSSYNDVIYRLIRDLGIQYLTDKKPIKVIMDGSINASMDFEGQMCINVGCFNYLTYEEILAVCAHEMAHYACLHPIMSMWKVAKKKKRNKMWAEIGYGLAVGAMAASSIYAGGYGVDTSYLNSMIADASLLNCAYGYANGATIKFMYRYNRNEETEADIISYRFMEQTGHGGANVISLLKKLRNMHGDTPTGIYDDHPSVSFRISVIEAMMNGYSGK